MTGLQSYDRISLGHEPCGHFLQQHQKTNGDYLQRWVVISWERIENGNVVEGMKESDISVGASFSDFYKHVNVSQTKRNKCIIRIKQNAGGTPNEKETFTR